MKALFMTAALAASAIALPAAAQDAGGPFNPETYLHGSYVELQGGSTFQGATTQFNATTGPGGGDNEGSGHFRPGLFGSFLLGHAIVPGVSLEAEGVYFKNHYDAATVAYQGVGGDTRTYGGFGNLRFSIPYAYRISRFALTPYIAGGIGYGAVAYRLTGLEGNDSGFMWQAKTGLEIKTGTPVSFDLGYRYIGTPEYHDDFQDGGVTTQYLKSHAQAATFGVKYSF